MVPATINLKEVLDRIFLGGEPESDTLVEEPTSMLVIGAGHARTGTSSLKAALQRLGLKSYHMKNAMMMDPELWCEHALERMKGNPGIYPKIMDTMAEQGYAATVDNPNILHYKELMARYPNAKVILGIRPRGGGESYAVSVLNTIARFAPLCYRVPFRWFSIFQKQNIIREWHFAEHGSPLHPITHYPNYQDLVDSYEAWSQQVQETVPPEKLLIFKPTDGWEPLCNFLSPLDPMIERNCQEISVNHEPFPFINDTAALQAFQDVFHKVAVVVENLPTLLLVFVCIVWWITTKKRRNCALKNAEKRKAN
jgi:hypothetical protein